MCRFAAPVRLPGPVTVPVTVSAKSPRLAEPVCTVNGVAAAPSVSEAGNVGTEASEGNPDRVDETDAGAPAEPFTAAALTLY